MAQMSKIMRRKNGGTEDWPEKAANLCVHQKIGLLRFKSVRGHASRFSGSSCCIGYLYRYRLVNRTQRLLGLLTCEHDGTHSA
jgi:hypothetical protein